MAQSIEHEGQWADRSKGYRMRSVGLLLVLLEVWFVVP